MKPVRITVLRKQLYEDIAERYLTDYPDVACDFFQEGDSFLYTGGAEMPQGFCPWAWIDIYSRVAALSAGGTYTPWQRWDGVNIVCCIDGVRPVSFLLEAVEA
ncbi:MAG: TIGR04076 family protein [Oscillospiraceae bacterium]|nr:TIGR04076 family protein [Oscillospiraceae bacterium]